MASNLKVDVIQYPNGTSYTQGHVIGVTHFQNSTRTGLPSSATVPYTLWSLGTVTKKKSNSYLVIEAQLPFLDGNSYDFGPFCNVNGTYHYDGVVFAHYNSDPLGTGSDTIKTALIWKLKHSGEPAGNVSIAFGWWPANGSTSERPGVIWNPNASDNGRARQWTSDCIVWEIET